MNIIHKILNDLITIQTKLVMFYPNAKSNDIKNIEKIMNNINNEELFYYKKIKTEYENYLNQKEIKAVSLDVNNSNIFFKIIYEDKCRTYGNNDGNNDIIIMGETEKDLNRLVNIISHNCINGDDINFLNNILNKISKKELNNIGEEIDKLIEQNELNTSINRINKDQIVNDFLLISKVKEIYDCAVNFEWFIEKTEVKQEEFTQINKTIIKYLEHPMDVHVIELSEELMKNYDIEFNNNTNYSFLNILKMLKDKNDIIDFMKKVNTKNINEYFEKHYFEKGYIDSVVECKKIFDNILNKDIKDKDMIKTFINNVKESDDIETSFLNVCYNFDEINVFFSNFGINDF